MGPALRRLKHATLPQSRGRARATAFSTHPPTPPPRKMALVQKVSQSMLAAVRTAGIFITLPSLPPIVRTFSGSCPLSENVPGTLWNLGRLNHVAIAVPDLNMAKSFYKNMLGAQVSEVVPVPEHGVSVVFVELGNTKLELLHPLGNQSPIEGFLKKNKAGGMHHICIEVDDIEAAVTDLKQKKICILSDKAKIGAHGKPVIFLHPKDCGGVLVELEQA